MIEGRAGNDVIDGDAYLNVRVAVHAWNPDKTPILNGDGSPVILGSVTSIAGHLTLGGITKTLPQWMLDGTINPGQLNIVREILYDASGSDTAVYWDVIENYDISRTEDGRVIVTHVAQTGGAIDPVTGRQRLSDGVDTLRNIEFLQFANGVIFDVGPINADPEGAPVISSAWPTQGVELTADIAGVTDADGIDMATVTFQWQSELAGEWVDIAGATQPTFTPGLSEVNAALRVVVSYTDENGTAEQVMSVATNVTGAQINGTGVADIIDGTAGADIINAFGGPDLVNTGAGPDIVDGGGGDDTINGGDGDDELTGGGGADVLNGDAGDDMLFGGNGVDLLNGGDGNDILAGGGGVDTVNGGDGDDTVHWSVGGGRDVIDGGAGEDTFVVTGDGSAEVYRIYTRDYWLDTLGRNPAQIHPDTAILVARGGPAAAAVFGNVIAELRGIEELVFNGLGGGDTFATFGDFTGTGLSYNTVTIEGGDGDDTIDISGLLSAHRIVFRTTGGNDRLIGNLRPQDVIVLAVGSVIADYTETANPDGTVTLSGSGHSVTYTGTPRIATAQEVIGDYVPDDAQTPDAESPDMADLPAADAPVTPEADPDPAPSAAPTVQFGTAGKDALIGGAGRDILFGDAGNDDILAGDGADMIFGDAGDDRIFGQDGDDYINAGAGNDIVFGGAGDDVITAQTGDGDDIYYGDDGSDTLDMSAITANITANLGTGFMGRGSVSSEQSGNDVIWSIENIVTGSGNDTITASGSVNVMDGGDGDNVFRFLSAADADGDVIFGFSPGDKLDLSGMDANAGAAGNQSFTIVSGGLSGPGELMMTLARMEGEDVTLVQGRTGTDDGEDFTITLKGTHDLTAGDFNL